MRVISRLAPAPVRSSTLVHSCTVLVAKHDLLRNPSTGWIKPVPAWLTNHNLCDMFYTLIEMFVYKLMLPFHKIWDITYCFILLQRDRSFRRRRLAIHSRQDLTVIASSHWCRPADNLLSNHRTRHTSFVRFARRVFSKISIILRLPPAAYPAGRPPRRSHLSSRV